MTLITRCTAVTTAKATAACHGAMTQIGARNSQAPRTMSPWSSKVSAIPSAPPRCLPGATPSRRLRNEFGSSARTTANPSSVPNRSAPASRMSSGRRSQYAGHADSASVATSTPMNITSAPRQVLLWPKTFVPPSSGPLSGRSRSKTRTGACSSGAPRTGTNTSRNDTALAPVQQQRQHQDGHEDQSDAGGDQRVGAHDVTRDPDQEADEHQ